MSYHLHGLGQVKSGTTSGATTGTKSGTTSGGAAVDNTARDWGIATTVGGGLATGIASLVGAATGRPTTPTMTETTDPLIAAPIATTQPAGDGWYWPVVIGVGALVLGGVAWVAFTSKPKQIQANRRRRHR